MISGAAIIPAVETIKSATASSVATWSTRERVSSAVRALRYSPSIGTNACANAPSAKSRRSRLGTLNATKNPSVYSPAPKARAITASRTNPRIRDTKVRLLMVPKALRTISSLTLVSRILGFVRDAVIARAFGAGLYTDAFFVAFRLPNLLRRLFAEGAFAQAFVPILGEYRNARTADDTRSLVEHVATLLAVAFFIVSTAGMIAAPLIIYLTAPGFVANAEKFTVTVQLLRITFPYILFISLTSFAGGILNTWSRFSVPAFTPTLLNVSFIVFALWFAPYFDPPILALALAVFAGGMLP